MSQSITCGKLFVLSACSGAGKTTVSKALIEKYGPSLNLRRVITYTSRAPRLGEVNGVDYHFISRDKFEHFMDQGFFLETTDYAGNLYGSPVSLRQDLKQGISYLMVTDRPGALVLKKLVPESVLIWLTVDTLETLRQRLEKRGTDAPKVIEKRLTLAEHEIDVENKEQAFDYHLANTVLEQTVENLKKVIVHELSAQG